MCNLKPNYLGIIGSILAIITIVFPWWTIGISYSGFETSYSGQLSVYLHQATATAPGISMTVSMNLWFGWTALAFVIIGGLLGLIGSVIASGRRPVLALAGILVLLSIIIFAAALQSQISNGSLANSYPISYPASKGLFSSGSYGYAGTSINYSAYLTFGFWLAVVAAIIMFVGLTRKTSETITTPKPSPPPPT